MCELCKSTPCHPKREKLVHVKELNKDDWLLIYNFIRFVQLPFIHSVILAARKREIDEAAKLPMR